MAQKIGKGERFGDWKLKKFLGEGGNGSVWLATNSNDEEAAIKILAKIQGRNPQKVYARFKREVNVVRANGDIEGLLPIIDLYLPDELTDELPWYVMPVAEPLDKYLDGRNFQIVVQTILEVGMALARLHERGISHRDIKPANILVRDDKAFLADFGLADYPDDLDLTSTKEQLGAKWTIAPEMKRRSHIADGKPADVYSLAKTLWILLTGQRDGFEGQYDPDSVNGLSRVGFVEPEESEFILHSKPRLVYIKPLDGLLRESTNEEPTQRPTMGQFVERLNQWVETYRNFRQHNPLQWRDSQIKLFSTVLPERAFWENIESIVQILDNLGSVDSLNHMLFPDSGGMDLIGAKLGAEPGTIELIINGGIVCIVKPTRLIFENFQFDWEWNYFRLETSDLQLTHNGHVSNYLEELVEIAPASYVSQEEWEADLEGEKRFPPDPRRIWIIRGGDFLFLQKTSTYNRIPATYDGRHNQMSTDEFRNYIAQKIQRAQELLQDKQLINLVKEKGLNIGDVIFNQLYKAFTDESPRFRRSPSV